MTKTNYKGPGRQHSKQVNDLPFKITLRSQSPTELAIRIINLNRCKYDTSFVLKMKNEPSKLLTLKLDTFAEKEYSFYFDKPVIDEETSVRLEFPSLRFSWKGIVCTEPKESQPENPNPIHN
jgi:hypothetical protein